MRTNEKTHLPLEDHDTEPQWYTNEISGHRVDLGPLLDFMDEWETREDLDLRFQKFIKYVNELQGLVMTHEQDDWLNKQYLGVMDFLYSLKDALWCIEKPNTETLWKQKGLPEVKVPPEAIKKSVQTKKS